MRKMDRRTRLWWRRREITLSGRVGGVSTPELVPSAASLLLLLFSPELPGGGGGGGRAEPNLVSVGDFSEVRVVTVLWWFKRNSGHGGFFVVVRMRDRRWGIFFHLETCDILLSFLGFTKQFLSDRFLIFST